MSKIRVNRRFSTDLLFISAILFNVQLINTEIITGNNSLETYLPDLIPNKDATIISNETSHYLTTISSIEEDEIQSIKANTPKSTTQIEESQAHIINDQTSSTLDISEETVNTIENNIKYEISNPPPLSVEESRIISTTITEISNPQSVPNSDKRLLEPDGDMIKVQKCCPSKQIMVLGQPGEQSYCQESNNEFNLNVFYNNETHYWNYTDTTADNVEIVSRDPCKESKFYLDPNDENDTFRVFANSSLYIPFSMDMFNTDQYCVDTIQGSYATFTTAVICTPHPKTDIFHFLYITGMVVSVISLIILITYTLRRNDIKEDHKKFLSIYAATMATVYILMIIQTIWHSSFNHVINVLFAYLIYYLNLKYYLWLNMFSFDTYRCVRDSNINVISYMKWYRIAAFLIPLVFVLLSFIDGFNPPLPNLYLEHSFSSSILFVIFLYIVPVFVSIIGNFLIFFKISLPRERYNNVKDLIATFQSKHWKTPPKNIKEIRKMYRRMWVLLFIIFALYVLDLVIYFLPHTGTQEPHFVIRDVVFCLQGLFISLTFVKLECCRRSAGRHDDTIPNVTEMEPMTKEIV